jgi:putative ABC transport system ATP-binding protein
MTVLIQARGLRKSFGPTDALRGIDLDIQRGEVVAVMGPSGSGKSSLLHCLAGVLLPDSGTVSVGGTVITALSEARRSALRLKEFGFVFQFGQLLPDLTAIDNVTIPLLLGGMKRRQALTAARGWLDRLGLEVAADQLPGELSGGEAQRVAIARALVTQPSVLFADEPTGSLDSLAAENVLTAMLELVRKAGTTLVMITHDPRTAAYADREIIVRDGQLAATDRVGIK